MRKLLRRKRNYKWLLVAVLCCFIYRTGHAQELASHWRQKEKGEGQQTGRHFALTQMLSDWEKEYNVNFYYDSELLKDVQIDKNKAKDSQHDRNLEKL